MPASYDFIIIGAGIVGLTVARELLSRYPRASIAVLDKEQKPGIHASGRNSGILHSGIYYAKDTLKAKVCSRGANLLYEFSREHGIDCNKNGKVILATSEDQLPTMDTLVRNAKTNNIKADKIDNKHLLEIEPFARPALSAIYCPDTAAIDSQAVMDTLYRLLMKDGVKFIFSCKLLALTSTDEISTSSGVFSYGYLFNCAGAYADKIAHMDSTALEYALVPFKGTYWKLAEHARHKVRGNIYPAPDINMPFLGVHLSRTISNEVYAGPTAIPALGRENYGVLSDLKFNEAFPIVGKLCKMYIKNKNNFRAFSHTEISKYFKSRFIKELKTLVTRIESDDLVPTSKTGIRPQLINSKTGELEMDYIIKRTINKLHVLNAISPAFTSSFAFAEIIVNKSETI